MKNFRKSGTTVSFTAAGTVPGGDIVLLGNGLFGVCAYDVVSADSGEAQMTGTFEFAKTSANTPAAFADAYWDDTAKEVTTTATANTLIGQFIQAYGSGDVLAQVRLKAQ